MSTTANEPSAVNGYLTDLAARLHGPRRTRNAILDEIRDGLHETIDANLTAGMDPHTATAHAITKFGTPRVVATAFAAELATAHARRTITALLVTGPLVGIWWLLLLDPRPWHTGPHTLITAIPAVPLLAAAVAAGLTTLVGTGRLTRWIPDLTPARALHTTITTLALCIAGDLTVIAAHATSTATPSTLAAIAVTASLMRITCAAAVLHRTNRLRMSTTAAASTQ